MRIRPTIFYVDDNLSSQRLLRLILSDAGFDVVTQNNPLDALRTAACLPFDLALLDYQMPQMTGSQLAQEIKDMHPEIPIVMISGFENLPASELACVDAFYGRSSSLNELLETIEILTGTPHSPASQEPVMTPAARGLSSSKASEDGLLRLCLDGARQPRGSKIRK